MESLPRFALVELDSQADIFANLVAIELAIQQAVAQHANLVVLPENAFCFGNQAFASQYFEALKKCCADLACHYNIHLLAGTLPCPYRPDGTPVPDNKLRQSSLLFNPSGDCVARYDKIHLFKAQVNDSTGSYDEGKTFEAGDTPVVAKTALGNIGMMVCFDLRFPALAWHLRTQGAEILTTPSAFTYATGEKHWQSLLIARALDSQCLVIGAAQTGDHAILCSNPQTPVNIRQTWGYSDFINADGQIMPAMSSKFVPFANPLLAQHKFSQTPIAQSTKTWLQPSNVADIPLDFSQSFAQSLLPSVVKVATVDFDKHAQLNCRQSIDLAQSQKFGISMLAI